MEVSTVSPLPASPTEGDDLCDTDVTNVAIGSVTLLMGLCGLYGNGAVFQLLTLKTSIVCIFDLAVTDFLFLLFLVPSTLLFLLEDVSCFPIMPRVYRRFLFHLSLASYYWGLFQLTFDGLVANMEKLCQLCWSHPPMHILWVLDTVHHWAFFVVITAIPTVTFLCQSHVQENCWVALTSMFTITLLLFAASMVMARTIDFIKVKSGSQQQQPERRDVVIFLIVLFSLPLSLWILLQQLSYMVVSSHVFFLLACNHRTIKSFTYFLAGRCWSPSSVGSLRESLGRVFEEQKYNTVRSHDTDSLNHDTDTGV